VRSHGRHAVRAASCWSKTSQLLSPCRGRGHKTSSGSGLEFDVCGEPGPKSMAQRGRVASLCPIGKSRWGHILGTYTARADSFSVPEYLGIQKSNSETCWGNGDVLHYAGLRRGRPFSQMKTPDVSCRRHMAAADAPGRLLMLHLGGWVGSRPLATKSCMRPAVGPFQGSISNQHSDGRRLAGLITEHFSPPHPLVPTFFTLFTLYPFTELL
jgi:hypothetical protein